MRHENKTLRKAMIDNSKAFVEAQNEVLRLGRLLSRIEEIQNEWWDGSNPMNRALSEIRTELSGIHVTG
jgi:hypothetical protein